MQKVLIIQGELQEYRIPVFNLLSEYYDVTVISSSRNAIEQKNYKFKYLAIELKHYKGFGRFFKIHLYKIASEFDVIISELTINYPQVLFLLLTPLRKRIILWGIGVPASYEIPFDGKSGILTNKRPLILVAGAVLFYSDYPFKKYVKEGFNSKKMFIANNTVEVFDSPEVFPRDIFLFIGSLYEAKGVEILLQQYKKALDIRGENLPKLYIIGKGYFEQKLKDFCDSNGLSFKVSFEGAIHDERILSKYFNRAILCISPNQAGLTVLKSMGYGVTFVTKENSFTGGERLNIQNNINGVLYHDDNELSEILATVYEQQEKFFTIGRNAKQYYNDNRTINHMVDGFFKAINYVLRQ